MADEAVRAVQNGSTKRMVVFLALSQLRKRTNRLANNL